MADPAGRILTKLTDSLGLFNEIASEANDEVETDSESYVIASSHEVQLDTHRTTFFCDFEACCTTTPFNLNRVYVKPILSDDPEGTTPLASSFYTAGGFSGLSKDGLSTTWRDFVPGEEFYVGPVYIPGRVQIWTRNLSVPQLVYVNFLFRVYENSWGVAKMRNMKVWVNE